MERKLILILTLSILLTSLFCVALRVERVQADEIIGGEAFASMTLPSDMPVVFVDPPNTTADLGDTITISVKIFNLSNTAYLADERLSSPPDVWQWGEPLPPYNPNGRFNYSLGNLYGLEVHFSWDSNVLEYVSHTVKVPVETYPDGILHEPIIDVMDDVDAVGGTYILVKSRLGIGGVFNKPGDNATVFEMTFNVTKIGRAYLNITWSGLAVPIADPNYADFFSEIPHWVKNGEIQTAVLATRIQSLSVTPFDNATLFTLPVISGESAFVSTTIINDGSITDTYNLTLHWGPTLLDSWLNETLESGEQKNYNYTIDEAELSIGNHTITAIISVLHNSSNLVDETVNQFRVIGTPILTILGPFSAEPGDTIYYTTNSTHSDPEGMILNYTWSLWGPGETHPRATQTGENATFVLHPLSTTGSWFVKLDVKDNYGVEYHESRPSSLAWHSEESLQIIPEFPSLTMFLLFMTLTLLVASVHRRRKSGKVKSTNLAYSW